MCTRSLAIGEFGGFALPQENRPTTLLRDKDEVAKRKLFFTEKRNIP